MKVGDKKKAGILGVVAVAALAFVVIRVMPPKEPKLLRAASASSAATITTPDAPKVEVPAALLNDPFSHPALAEKKAPDPQAPPKPTKEPGKSGGDGWAEPTPVDPLAANANLTKDAIGHLPKIGPVPLGSADPADAAKEKTGTTVTLCAVLRAGKRWAFVSINSQDPIPLGLGQYLSKTLRYRVTFIDSDGIVLTGGDQSRRLPVGHKATL